MISTVPYECPVSSRFQAPLDAGERRHYYAGAVWNPRCLVALALSLGSSGPILAQEPPGAALPRLTRIAQIRALSQDGGALGYRVQIRATVTHFDRLARNSLVVHDG